MAVPVELLLALRYLRPKRTYVSAVTVISILGVTIGVAVLIVVLSVMTGFDRQLREKLLGFNAHLKVYPSASASIHNYSVLIDLIKQNSNVVAVAPFVMGQVLIETQPANPETEQPRAAAPWIKGVDPYLEQQISALPKSVVSGKFDLANRGVAIGTELARQLNIRVGDRLAVYSPRELQKMRRTNEEAKKDPDQQTAILPEDYEVRAIFDVGYYEYNAAVVLVSLEDAQDMYELGDSVHGLMITLHDPYMAGAVQPQLEAILGAGYQVVTWTEENSTILNALAVEKSMMFYLLFFIMVVAAMSITSALITFVVQKTREIGILKAIGATNTQVALLFLAQSSIVGVIGVIAGLILGLIAVEHRNDVLHFLRQTTGWELFPASVYGFFDIPALIVPGDICLICGSALLMCAVAGLLPAWHAMKLAPVQALRHE